MHCEVEWSVMIAFLANGVRELGGESQRRRPGKCGKISCQEGG